MDRNEIIKKIHEEGKILEVCKNIAKGFADDLYMEVIMILLEYKELEQVFSKSGNSFNYFVIKIINNIWCDNSRRFHKRYISGLNYTDIHTSQSDLADKIKFESELLKIEKAMAIVDADCRQKKVYPLGGKLFEIYLRQGSIRKVQKKTNIHANHVHKEITNYRKEVLKVYKEL